MKLFVALSLFVSSLALAAGTAAADKFKLIHVADLQKEMKGTV